MSEGAAIPQPGSSQQPITTLLADDDEDDREFVRDAVDDARVADQLRCVVDGQDLVDYLRRAGRYAQESAETPRPGMILLDLNMPRKDGREVLAEIKSDHLLRRIPVVVLTTSSDEQDVAAVYDLGANFYITTPATSAALHTVINRLTDYWDKTVALPPSPEGEPVM